MLEDNIARARATTGCVKALIMPLAGSVEFISGRSSGPTTAMPAVVSMIQVSARDDVRY